ncbi:MAG: hypothetical protein R6X20_00320 [Phycisphaerae bacterium]
MPSAFAQHIDVTASLDVTDGLVRVGAYVPVTLKVTNRTDRAVTEVLVSTGGPVDVRVPWHVQPGETAERTVRAFCGTADVAVEAAFFDGRGRAIATVRPAPPVVRLVSDETVVAAVQTPLELTEAMQADLRRAFGTRPLRVVSCDAQAVGLLYLGGFADAAVRQGTGTGFCITGAEPSLVLRRESFWLPPRTPVLEPGTVRLLAGEGQAGVEPLRLWIGLGVYTMAVLVVVAALAFRRWVAGGALAVTGVAAAVLLVFVTGTGAVTLRQARVFYARPQATHAPVETLTHLASPGDGAAHIPIGESAPNTLVRPVAAGPGQMHQRHAVLDLRRRRLTALRPRLVVRWSDDAPLPMTVDRMPEGAEDLAGVARRPDTVAALLVRADGATGPDGRTRPLDAWAVAWKTSGDEALAWCGRSLAWWDEHRRTGDGPFLVAWFRDPAPEPPEGIDVYERLPAMVVYSE